MVKQLFVLTAVPQNSVLCLTDQLSVTVMRTRKFKQLLPNTFICRLLSNRNSPEQLALLKRKAKVKHTDPLSSDGQIRRANVMNSKKHVSERAICNLLQQANSIVNFMSGLPRHDLRGKKVVIVSDYPQNIKRFTVTITAPPKTPRKIIGSVAENCLTCATTQYIIIESNQGHIYFLKINITKTGCGMGPEPVSLAQNPRDMYNSTMFPPYHLMPPTPAHVHHLKSHSNAPHFFMADELRHYLLERHALTLAQVDPEQYPDLPTEVDMYHELVPIEPPHSANKSSMFGYATSAYKSKKASKNLCHCGRTIFINIILNIKKFPLTQIGRPLYHNQGSHFFVPKLSENKVVFFYSKFTFIGSNKLQVTKFGTKRGLPAVKKRIEETDENFNLKNNSTFFFTKIQIHVKRRGPGLLSESTLWNYIIQLTGALRTIHTGGLSCRTLDPTKILLTDNKSRIRINCCGILDVLNFDPNAASPLAAMPQYQQEDLVNLGKLMVALACNSVVALQRDNIQGALELINRSYSRDLAMLLVCLLTSQRIKTINDVMPMIGARFYTALETSNQRADAYECEMGKEIHNGRLFRLLAKLNTIVDRPHLNLDNTWCETGDRYMLKLFRDFVFHQLIQRGRPGAEGIKMTVIEELLLPKAPIICLMSHDEQNILVTSYAELKRCFERSFAELLQAASSHKTSLS
ncbi:unnamed protein product, partial [Meganyctiphanes norvegica]